MSPPFILDDQAFIRCILILGTLVPKGKIFIRQDPPTAHWHRNPPCSILCHLSSHWRRLIDAEVHPASHHLRSCSSTSALDHLISRPLTRRLQDTPAATARPQQIASKQKKHTRRIDPRRILIRPHPHAIHHILITIVPAYLCHRDQTAGPRSPFRRGFQYGIGRLAARERGALVYGRRGLGKVCRDAFSYGLGDGA